MKIFEEAPLGAGARYFAVELEITDDPEDAGSLQLWESATDKGKFGVPHAGVICETEKAKTSLLRASLQRFNQSGDDWQWNLDALSRHLLRDLCGIQLVGRGRYPPDREICPHGNPYAIDDGVVEWLRAPCVPCVANGEPELLHIELNTPDGLGDR